MVLKGESEKTWRKACPSATLSTANLTMGCRGLESDRPATDRLMHGTGSSA